MAKWIILTILSLIVTICYISEPFREKALNATATIAKGILGLIAIIIIPQLIATTIPKLCIYIRKKHRHRNHLTYNQFYEICRAERLKQNKFNKNK